MNTYILSLYLTATILISLAIYAWWYRHEPVALPFALTLSLAAAWAITYGLELASPTLGEKILWHKIRFLFIPYLPLAWLSMVYAYTRGPDLPSKRYIAILVLIPIFTTVFALTSDYHTLFRYNFRLNSLEGHTYLTFETGPWHWINQIYHYAVFLTTLGLLLEWLRRANRLQRRQAIVITASIFLPLIADLLFQVGVFSVSGYNPAPSVLTLSAILMGIGLFRFKLLDVIPIARNTLVEKIPDAVLVLDERGHLIDANPAAQRMLNLDSTTWPGESIVNLLPQVFAETSIDSLPDTLQTELQLPAPEPLHVEMRLLSIMDARGKLSGRLIVLHDMTSCARAKQELLNAQALYRTLVETIPMGIFQKNLMGEYIFVNQRCCNHIKKTRAEILGKTDRDLFPPAKAQQHIESDQRVISTGQPFSGIDEYASTSNQVHYIEYMKIPVYSANGVITGVQGIFWDVTERIQINKETQQRLKELAFINAITQAISSQKDLHALLALIAQTASELLGVQSIYIALYNHETNSVEIPYMLEEGQQITTKTHSICENLTAHILETRQPLTINKQFVKTCQALHIDLPASPPSKGYPHAWVGVPILANQQCIGVIGAASYTSENAFREADVRLLSAVASNIGIALQKAQLYAQVQHELEERQRAEKILWRQVYELGLVNEISRLAASAEHDLDHLIESVGKKIEEIFLTKSVFIALYNPQTNQMDVHYWSINSNPVERISFPMGVGLAAHVFNSQKPLLIDEDFLPRAQSLGAYLIHAKKYGYPKTWLGVPMLHHEHSVGVISIQDYEKEKAYNQFAINLLTLIANTLAIHIANARLYETIRKDNLDLQEKIAQIAALQAELREQAIRDPLTNLFNRRYMEETLSREISRADRENLPLSVLVMDIDHFKAFNDRYGHLAGDAMLRALGKLLLEKTRDSDIACRYGGEEFIVVMPGSPLHVAHQRAEEIRQLFEKTNVPINSHTLSATISIGIATYQHQSHTIQALIEYADQALYRAKANGRNRVELATPPE